MSEQEKQEGQKTVVAFIAGLLIGGLLVWVFSTNPEAATAPSASETDPIEVEVSETDTDTTSEAVDVDATTTEEVNTVEVGEGSIDITDQKAGMSVTIDGAIFPVTNGWIAVRPYNDGKLGNILGAARFSQEQGLAPNSVPLLSPTISDREYAVVFYSDDGNQEFNLDGDAQLDVVMETFTAN